MHDPERLAAILDPVDQRTQPLREDTALQEAMQRCVTQGLDEIPLPGGGETWQRWQTLAELAAHDLSLTKLYEGHTDAIAILRELQSTHLLPSGVGAVWAAEPPHARVQVSRSENGCAELTGTKAWCSGAAQIDWALLTAWGDHEQPQLALVALDQPQVRVGNRGWQAVGMAATASVEVSFEQATAQLIGTPGDYLARPGFWHGGAGIAACWYGAATGLARYLRHFCQQRENDTHALAHLGAVDAALSSAAATLRACAQWIDNQPIADAQLPVRRVRAQVEQACEQVLHHVGRAMGATPFCRDARFARLAADLPVFLRQSHAERDLADLGRLVTAQDDPGWQL